MSLKYDSKAENRKVLRTDLRVPLTPLSSNSLLCYFHCSKPFLFNNLNSVINFKVNFDLFQLAVFPFLSNNF